MHSIFQCTSNDSILLFNQVDSLEDFKVVTYESKNDSTHKSGLKNLQANPCD